LPEAYQLSNFRVVRPASLPEDVRYIGTDLQALQALAPRLADWLGKVFTVMGGFMAAAELLFAYFGGVVMPTRPTGSNARSRSRRGSYACAYEWREFRSAFGLPLVARRFSNGMGRRGGALRSATSTTSVSVAASF
jgi:hypothetical protein